jgi:hypothetical protein
VKALRPSDFQGPIDMKNDVSKSPLFPAPAHYNWLPTWPRLTAPVGLLATPGVTPIRRGTPSVSETEAANARGDKATPVAEAA